ncbi:MAG: hypothetical protein ACI9OD_005046 [Limisphaerales bacterium]|jgi:hypothetical protein
MNERRAASGLLWAETGFRKIRHYEDLPKLREAPADSASTTNHNDRANRHLVLTISGTSPS